LTFDCLCPNQMGLQAQLNLTVINSVAAKSQKKMMEEGFATDLQPCSS
jgi:hypothetical protein